MDIAASPSWSGDGKYQVSAAGIQLSFQKASSWRDGHALVSALVLDGAKPGEILVTVEARFPALRSAFPARFSPGGSEDVAFLGIHGGGADAARGYYDPQADRGVDFAMIHRGLRLSSSVDESGRRILVKGRLPRGRKVALFAFKEREGLLFPGGKPQGAQEPRAVEGAARSLAGVSFRGGRGLLGRAEKLLSQAPLFRGAYLEVGDGWQEKGETKRLREPSRSWIPREGSPEGRGAKESLADVIGKLKELRFYPGLWIVPHGQSEEWVFRKSPEAFVRDAKGNPAPGGFVGRYVVDGTSPAGLAYLADLFRELRASGCKVFRLGGLRDVLAFYKSERMSLQNPGIEPIRALRDTLGAIREGAGGDALLAGDWDTAAELVGLLDTALPLTLQEDGIDPLQQEGFASARGYFRHRGAWWVECFPVTGWVDHGKGEERKEWARSRILFAALTGRGLLLDGSAALSPWAEELLRAAGPGPPAPVRPMDLFPLQGLPRVWDLKLGDDSTGGDLVGLFNWSLLSSATVTIHPPDLGLSLEEGESYFYFDALSGACLGRGRDPKDFFLLSGRSLLLSVQRDLGRPQVVAASGPYLALANQLEVVIWDETALELRGRAVFPAVDSPGGEKLRLHIVCGPGFKASQATAEGGRAELSVTGSDVVLDLEASGPGLSFRVGFTFEAGSAVSRGEGLFPPRDLRVTFLESEQRPYLEWSAGAGGTDAWRSIEGFQVLRDGMEMGRATSLGFLDATAQRGKAYQYSVRSLGSRSPETGPVSFTVPAARDAYLDALSISHWSQKPGFPAKRRSVSGGPLSISGRRFDRGLGTRAPSRIDYKIDGAYALFESRSGVDDAARFQGSVVFAVEVDGVERYRSPVIHGGSTDLQVRVPIAAGQVLSLIVEDAKDGAESDLADWADARVIASGG
jgi:hypothetical protein